MGITEHPCTKVHCLVRLDDPTSIQLQAHGSNRASCRILILTARLFRLSTSRSVIEMIMFSVQKIVFDAHINNIISLQMF